MATSVSKTFTERFSYYNQGRGGIATVTLTSETQSGSTYTRTYTITPNDNDSGTVSMDISIPSDATITNVNFTNDVSRSGELNAYTNMTLSLPDYGGRTANNNNIKNYLNNSHPSAIRLYWYFGFYSTTFTRTEATTTQQVGNGAYFVSINWFTPKLIVTYTMPEEEATVSFGNNNTWQKCKIYYAVNGVWQKVKGYFGTDGTWKQVK